MGDFRSGGRSFGGRGRSGGSSRGFGGRGGFGERRPLQMHDATCSKCQKQCQIPFRPTGDRPVFCSECFRNESGSNSSFSSGRDRPSSSSSGISQEQFKQINSKLDKILDILEEIEFEDDEDSGDEDDKVVGEEDENEELVEDEDEKIVEDEAPVEDKSKDSEEDLDDESDDDLDDASPDEIKTE
jgi:CxxC-x17-CxxC domain-containing protein